MEDLFANTADATPGNVRAIQDTFLQCYAAKLAVETITTEILKGELTYNTDTDHSIDREQHEFWQQFIRTIIINLNLYGYAVYRYIPKGKRDSKHELAEVADPESHAFVMTDTSMVLQSTNSLSGRRLKGSRYWKATVLSRPMKSTGSNPTMEFTSAGWRSLNDARAILAMEDNMSKRDDFNSAPTVYTEISQNISGSSTQRPWFHQPGISDRIATPMVPRDFNTIVEERAETIAKLDDLTEETRQRARERYAGNYRLGDGGSQKDIPKEHRELIVSDGRRAAPVPFLRAPENYYNLITRYEHRIMFAYGVPPQTIGENINSERNAASSRLADVSLQNFQTTCDRIRSHVNKALRDISIFITKDPDIYLVIKPCTTMFHLAKLEGILSLEACRRMYACAYNIDEKDIDLEALKRRQETINASQASKERTENTSAADTTTKTKNRPTMTVEQKTFRDADKAAQRM